MPRVRFIPDEAGEASLRLLQREPEARRLPGLWLVSGALELDLGSPGPLRVGCASPITSGLEPLSELAAYALSGRAGRRNRFLGTAALGRSSHLYYRYRAEHEAVLVLAGSEAALGLSPDKLDPGLVCVTVLEADQPALEDEVFTLRRRDLAALPLALWDDLDALLSLLEIELEPRERARWERLRLPTAER